MKIALACKSLLLTKTLEIFLKKNISSYKKCDFVISDNKIEIDKPLFVISGNTSNLQAPFSESALMIELDKFYSKICTNKISNDSVSEAKNTDLNESLKEKIDFLTKKFRDDLIFVMQEYYEKK